MPAPSLLSSLTARPGRVALAVVLPALAVPLIAVAPASASGRPGVRASGPCSGPSHWTLSAKADNGKVEVEAEVDTPRNGRTWAWQLADNGTRFASGRSVTTAPSGSFTVRRLTANRAGADRITLTARSVSTGETCAGSVRLG